MENLNDPVFPSYRKFVGLNIWFKIISKDEFIEIKQVGERYQLSTIHAVQFPEKLRIQDMLLNHDNTWESVTEEEVENLLKSIS